MPLYDTSRVSFKNAKLTIEGIPGEKITLEACSVTLDVRQETLDHRYGPYDYRIDRNVIMGTICEVTARTAARADLSFSEAEAKEVHRLKGLDKIRFINKLAKLKTKRPLKKSKCKKVNQK